MTEPTTLTALVVDAVKGTIIERLIEPAVAPAWDAIRPILFPWWDPALHEIRLNLAQAAEELRRKDAAHVEALVRSLQHGEADALVTAFLRAAAQATTQGRMKLLAAAATGVFTPNLNSEMRSRASRAIMELEPSDVLELRTLDEAERRPGINQSAMMTPGREPLARAGCVADTSAQLGGTVRISALGQAVLTALRAWSPNRAFP